MLRLTLYIVIMAAFYGCISPASTLHFVDVDPRGWSSSEVIEVSFINDDTLALNNISLYLKLSANSPLRTIPVVITIVSPDSSHFEELFNLYLPEKSTIDNETFWEVIIPYRTYAKFQDMGEYTFKVAPHRRELKDVFSVGIQITQLKQ